VLGVYGCNLQPLFLEIILEAIIERERPCRCFRMLFEWLTVIVNAPSHFLINVLMRNAAAPRPSVQHLERTQSRALCREEAYHHEATPGSSRRNQEDCLCKLYGPLQDVCILTSSNSFWWKLLFMFYLNMSVVILNLFPFCE
jgi:hypothetical protein